MLVAVIVSVVKKGWKVPCCAATLYKRGGGDEVW